MSMDLVWNEAAAGKVQAACEQAMNRQSSDMGQTVAYYKMRAAELDMLASEQENIAATAMMSSYRTDANGLPYRTQVADIVTRAIASSRAADYRAQAEAIRQAIAELEAAIASLGNVIRESRDMFFRLQGQIQNADMNHAAAILAVKQAILAYTSRIRGIFDSFSDILPMVQARSITSLMWGPTSGNFDPLFAGMLAGRNKSCAFGSDPVNLATGNFIYSKTDIEIPGRFPLAFKRFYNSSGGPDSFCLCKRELKWNKCRYHSWRRNIKCQLSELFLMVWWLVSFQSRQCDNGYYG